MIGDPKTPALIVFEALGAGFRAKGWSFVQMGMDRWIRGRGSGQLGRRGWWLKDSCYSIGSASLSRLLAFSELSYIDLPR